MPKRAQETEAIRRQTRWFIEDAPTTIQLVPHPEVRSPAGGRTRSPGTPRRPQTVRFIPLDRQRTSQRTLDGAGSQQVEVAFTIIGDADLEIAKYDRFTVGGQTYEVTEVQPSESAPYIRRADVFVIPLRGEDG